MLRAEVGLVLVSLLLGLIRPQLGSRWFERLETNLARLSRNHGLAVGLVCILALVLRAAYLPLLPIPEPIIHDEFGYLLAADTFAHGRLTNPTHPMWVHFESFNILHKPTYQCINPPVQGMILAFGKVLLGNPFWGVWLSAGLMCAAITWMLQAWLPAQWALLGGMLAVLRYGVLTYWANSYWGGTAGAIGGALVLGALPRIKDSQRMRDVFFMALGLALLANNRPYDGLVFSLPVVVSLTRWMLAENRASWRMSLRRVVFPLMGMLVLASAGTGYYFWRVTGSPFRMPYQIERKTYAVAPYLLLQPLRPEPVYHHAVMRQLYAVEEPMAYRLSRSPIGVAIRFFWAWKFFLGPLLTFPLLILAFILPYGLSWRDISANTRFLLMTMGIVAMGCLMQSFYVAAHYSSPATGVVLALVLVALKEVSSWRFRGKPTGTFLLRAFTAIAAIMFVVRSVAGPLHIPLSTSAAPAWFEKGLQGFGRADVQRQLLRLPEPHLVVVRYKPDHGHFAEWVYNDADIDHSRIVWAREMGSADDGELMNYFKDRRVWLVEADERPPKLFPYPGSAGPMAPTVSSAGLANQAKSK